MEIRSSTLQGYQFTAIKNTFLNPPGEGLYSDTNLFYISGAYTEDLKEWVEHFTKRKQEFLFVKGTRRQNWNKRRVTLNTVWAIFKVPISVNKSEGCGKSQRYLDAHPVGFLNERHSRFNV